MASRQQYTLEVLLGARTSSSFSGNLSKAKNGISGISSTAKKAAGLITAAFAGVNLVGGIKDAIETYSGWEQELTNSAAIANASVTEYEQMARASREAGKATTKTAEESASALGYMALAGWDVKDSTSALMPVLKLSESTNLDLARTSDLVTDSMSALKLSVSDLPGYLDMVTKSQNSSNQTSEQLMEGYIKAGGAARALGIDAKDSAIMLGILANNGTKGAEGGRSVNAMLTRMASNDSAIQTFKKLKISIFDTKGEFVGMEEALKRINKGLGGLNQEKRTFALKQIAGTQYFSKMNYLLDGVKEGADGAESAWDELDRKLDDSEGTLDEMDAKITGTTSGSLQKMNSAVDDMKISFVDAFDGEFANIIDDFTEMFNDISSAINDFAEDNEAGIHLMFEEITGGVKTTAGIVLSAGQAIVDNLDLIKGAAISAGTAMGAFKVSKGIGVGVKVLKGLKDVDLSKKTSKEIGKMAEGLSSLGIKGGLAAAGVAVGVAAIAGIGYAVHTAKENAVEANLEEHFGNISLSLEQIDDIAQRIVGKKKLTLIVDMMEAIGETDTAIDSMKKSFRDFQSISWKVNAGIKIDSDDTDAYANSVKSYVQSAQDAIDKQGYTVSVATKILFGKNTKIGKDNDAFYAGLNVELDGLEKKLNKKINKAVKDGISIDKDKAIQKLLKQVSDITSAVTAAEDEAKFHSMEKKYAGLSGANLDADTMKQLSKDVKEYTDQANEGAEEARTKSLESIYAQKNLGKITESQAAAKEKKIDEAYYKTKAESIKKGSDFLMKTFTDAYPEAKTAMSKLNGDINQELQEMFDGGVSGEDFGTRVEGIIDKVSENIDLPEDTKGAISQYFKNGLGSIMADTDALQAEMDRVGVEKPASLDKSMDKMTALAAVSGSTQDVGYLTGYAIADNKEWELISQMYNDIGYELPVDLAEGIERSAPLVKESVSKLMAMINQMPEGNLRMKVTTEMAKTAADDSPGSGVKDALPQFMRGTKGALTQSKQANKGGSKKKVHRNARGGIYDKPILTTFAEEGAEAAIPLDGSVRAKALWQNAGKILGMEPTEDKTMYQMSKGMSSDRAMYEGLKNIAVSRQTVTEGANVQITYAPVIEVKGNADEQTLTKVVDMSQAKFAAMMKQYEQSKKRVVFGN